MAKRSKEYDFEVIAAVVCAMVLIAVVVIAGLVGD